MGWVVRIDDADPEAIEIAATMADASGWAEVDGYCVVGFEDRQAAERFASDHHGSIEVTRPWSDDRVITLILPNRTLEIAPGPAFGHGRHPTTHLALNAIANLGEGGGRTMLDVGTGTGVLSLAAAQQGFIATGCDIDPEAVAVAISNAERNALTDSTSFVTATPTQLATPQWLTGSSGFDVVVVNALVGVHETEGPSIAKLAAQSATLICTGLRGQTQVSRAVAAYPGFHLVDHDRSGPWSLLTLRR